MSRRQVQILIVCEDRTQEVFVRRSLERIGFEVVDSGGVLVGTIALP